MDRIEFFKGEYDFLSNFATSPLVTSLLPPMKSPDPKLPDWNGVCSSVEHAYQALKTISESERFYVVTCSSAGSAKKRGRRVTIRPDWDRIKVPIMEQLVQEKFEQNPHLAEALLATGNSVLVEGNWWGDTFWGVCRGVGQNHLGNILMRVRERIRGSR